MPYKNWENNRNVQLFTLNPFIKAKAAMRLRRDLQNTDFSVVASRRSALSLIEEFRNTEDADVDINVRFPEVGLFINLSDQTLYNILIDLIGALSFRDMQKDQSDNSRGIGKNLESVKDQIVGMTYNDAHKAFLEHTKRFGNHISRMDHLYDQARFEKDFGVTWVGGSAPPRGNIQNLNFPNNNNNNNNDPEGSGAN